MREALKAAKIHKRQYLDLNKVDLNPDQYDNLEPCDLEDCLVDERFYDALKALRDARKVHYLHIKKLKVDGKVVKITLPLVRTRSPGKSEQNKAEEVPSRGPLLRVQSSEIDEGILPPVPMSARAASSESKSQNAQHVIITFTALKKAYTNGQKNFTNQPIEIDDGTPLSVLPGVLFTECKINYTKPNINILIHDADGFLFDVTNELSDDSTKTLLLDFISGAKKLLAKTDKGVDRQATIKSELFYQYLFKNFQTEDEPPITLTGIKNPDAIDLDKITVTDCFDLSFVAMDDDIEHQFDFIAGLLSINFSKCTFSKGIKLPGFILKQCANLKEASNKLAQDNVSCENLKSILEFAEESLTLIKRTIKSRVKKTTLTKGDFRTCFDLQTFNAAPSTPVARTPVAKKQNTAISLRGCIVRSDDNPGCIIEFPRDLQTIPQMDIQNTIFEAPVDYCDKSLPLAQMRGAVHKAGFIMNKNTDFRTCDSSVYWPNNMPIIYRKNNTENGEIKTDVKAFYSALKASYQRYFGSGGKFFQFARDPNRFLGLEKKHGIQGGNIDVCEDGVVGLMLFELLRHIQEYENRHGVTKFFTRQRMHDAFLDALKNPGSSFPNVSGGEVALPFKVEVQSPSARKSAIVKKQSSLDDAAEAVGVSSVQKDFDDSFLATLPLMNFFEVGKRQFLGKKILENSAEFNIAIKQFNALEKEQKEAYPELNQLFESMLILSRDTLARAFLHPDTEAGRLQCEKDAEKIMVSYLFLHAYSADEIAAYDAALRQKITVRYQNAVVLHEKFYIELLEKLSRLSKFFFSRNEHDCQKLWAKTPILDLKNADCGAASSAVFDAVLVNVKRHSGITDPDKILRAEKSYLVLEYMRLGQFEQANHCLNACKMAWSENKNEFSMSQGIKALRDAVCSALLEMYKNDNGEISSKTAEFKGAAAFNSGLRMDFSDANKRFPALLKLDEFLNSLLAENLQATDKRELDELKEFQQKINESVFITNTMRALCAEITNFPGRISKEMFERFIQCAEKPFLWMGCSEELKYLKELVAERLGQFTDQNHKKRLLQPLYNELNKAQIFLTGREGVHSIDPDPLLKALFQKEAVISSLRSALSAICCYRDAFKEAIIFSVDRLPLKMLDPVASGTAEKILKPYRFMKTKSDYYSSRYVQIYVLFTSLTIAGVDICKGYGKLIDELRKIIAEIDTNRPNEKNDDFYSLIEETLKSALREKEIWESKLSEVINFQGDLKFAVKPFGFLVLVLPPQEEVEKTSAGNFLRLFQPIEPAPLFLTSQQFRTYKDATVKPAIKKIFDLTFDYMLQNDVSKTLGKVMLANAKKMKDINGREIPKLPEDKFGVYDESAPALTRLNSNDQFKYKRCLLLQTLHEKAILQIDSASAENIFSELKNIFFEIDTELKAARLEALSKAGRLGKQHGTYISHLDESIAQVEIAKDIVWKRKTKSQATVASAMPVAAF